MKFTAQFTVEKAETKTGTSKAGSDYAILEYTLHCTEPRDDGACLETDIIATPMKTLDALAVGTKFTGTIFITSHEWNGKIFNGFRLVRIDNVEVPETEPESEPKTITESVVDDIPF